MNEASSKRLGIVQELDNLKRKTALMQSCHGKLAEQFTRREKLSSMFVTLMAGLAIIATTAEARTLLVPITEEDLRRAAALFSISVFIATLFRLEARWSAQAGMHSVSLEALTKFLRRLDIILKTLEDKTDLELETLAHSLAKEYTDITEAAPKIASQKFLALKQQHLQTIAISRALDKDAFISLRKIRKQLKSEKTIE